MSPKLAIVVSQFHGDITLALLRGAKKYLAEKNVVLADNAVFSAPGDFELPLIAQALADLDSCDGVICLGCAIKGETAHFEYMSLATSLGIMKASLTTKKPISFGILTTYTDEQALARSRDDAFNKGREAAAACLETIATLRQIRAMAKQLN